MGATGAQQGTERESRKRTWIHSPRHNRRGSRPPGNGCGYESSGTPAPLVPLPSRPPPLWGLSVSGCGQAIGPAHRDPGAKNPYRESLELATTDLSLSLIVEVTEYKYSLFVSSFVTCFKMLFSHRPTSLKYGPCRFFKIPPARPTGSWKSVELV